MTYTTITQATRDEALQDRVMACACKEAWNSAEYSLTIYGERLRTYPTEAITTFMWPVAIDYEAAYQFAVDSDHQNPGGDPGVITDANIQACIQVHWPHDAIVPLPTEMVPPTDADLRRQTVPEE